MSTKDFLEALAAGGAGGVLLLAIVRWIFQGHFYDWVIQCFNARREKFKDIIDGWYQNQIAEREKWYDRIRKNSENIRRIAHSVKGLRILVLRHDGALLAMQSIPSQMTAQLELLREIKEVVTNMQETVNTHSTEIAVLVERRNHPRT